MITGYLPLGNFDFDLMSCTDRFSDSLLDEKLRRDTERIRDRRFNLAFQAFVWWIIPVLMVYALGWATAWVVRGFQNKSKV
jgi:hypothetical protein